MIYFRVAAFTCCVDQGQLSTSLNQIRVQVH